MFFFAAMRFEKILAKGLSLDFGLVVLTAVKLNEIDQSSLVPLCAILTVLYSWLGILGHTKTTAFSNIPLLSKICAITILVISLIINGL